MRSMCLRSICTAQTGVSHFRRGMIWSPAPLSPGRPQSFQITRCIQDGCSLTDAITNTGVARNQSGLRDQQVTLTHTPLHIPLTARPKAMAKGKISPEESH